MKNRKPHPRPASAKPGPISRPIAPKPGMSKSMAPRPAISRTAGAKPPISLSSIRNPQAKAPTTDWGGVAEWYDRLVGDDGSEFHREVILPGLTRLLALPQGATVVDVACGQGVLARHLHERGLQVTGIDAAAELIRAARERGPAQVAYHVADARELSFLPPAAFDAAACVLAIQNINPIQPVFEHVARVLKERGKIVLVMMHPSFRGPKETSWGWDIEKEVQFRRVDRYLLPRKTPIVTHPGVTKDVYTWTFHKPLEAYVKALRNTGLLIDALEEWPSHKNSTSGPKAAAENMARKEIPMFMAIRAVKVSAMVGPLEPTKSSDAPSESGVE